MERHQAPSSPGRPILKVFLVNCYRGARGVYIYILKNTMVTVGGWLLWKILNGGNMVRGENCIV